MLFFGYIISDIKYNDLNEDIVKVVSSTDECIRNIPRLIVGLDNAKKYASDNNMKFDILEHTYENGDMWTFKKTEKREFYEEDLESFKKMIVEKQGSDINYYYINIYALRYTKFKRLYNILFNNILNRKYNYIIIDKDMFYFSVDDINTFGVSFTHLAYMGIEKDRIIDKLKKGINNRLYFTTSKKMWKLKEWFNGREYVISHVFEENTQKR